MSASEILSAEKCSFGDLLPPPPAMVLLVLPRYRSSLPPLGLLKLASYCRARGDVVRLVRYPDAPGLEPDVVLVATLFTYAWRAVADAVRFYRSLFPRAFVILGGTYASLMPDHAASATRPDIVWVGHVREAEELLPLYDLVPRWEASILFSSRGCIRRCGFCAVPRLEPAFEARASIRHLISPDHSSVVLLDNNFLASPWWREVLAELAATRNALGRVYRVDFNQGLDARLMTPEVAARLAELRIPLVRLAYDGPGEREAVRKAIAALSGVGVRKKDILVYALFNYLDTPECFLARVKDLMEWGVAVYPMRYQPLDALRKDEYVAPGWDVRALEMVVDARRVLGVNGTFPPREALRRKFLRAKTFAEAFALDPPRRRPVEKGH